MFCSNLWRDTMKQKATEKRSGDPGSNKKLADGYRKSTSTNFTEYTALGALEAVDLPPVDWKIHISVEPNEDNVQEAFNKILPVLLKYNIKNFKIATPDALERGVTKGKTITIYLGYNQELAVDKKKFKECLSSIESSLQKSDVVPGKAIAGDARLDGSIFMHYRHEGGPKQHVGEGNYMVLYMDDETSQKNAKELGTPPHNPFMHPDNFGLEGIQLGMDKDREINLDILKKSIIQNLSEYQQKKANKLAPINDSDISAFIQSIKRTKSEKEISGICNNLIIPSCENVIEIYESQPNGILASGLKGALKESIADYSYQLNETEHSAPPLPTTAPPPLPTTPTPQLAATAATPTTPTTPTTTASGLPMPPRGRAIPPPPRATATPLTKQAMQELRPDPDEELSSVNKVG